MYKAQAHQHLELAAALHLTCNEQPETITEMDDIDTILERQSRAWLMTLVKQLLQKQPEVEWQLTMPPLTGYKSVPIDTGEYRRQVDFSCSTRWSRVERWVTRRSRLCRGPGRLSGEQMR